MAEKTQIVITAKDETGAAIASAKRGLDSLKTAGSSLAGTFATLGVGGGLVGLIGGAGATAMLKQTIDDLDKLNQSAERLGVSASKLETLEFAGKLAGLEDGDIEKALTKISVKLEEAAAGGKEAIKWFDKLGVSWLDASGKVKTADQAFADVADRISEMEDGTGKVTTLVEGFGEKLGRKLAPALNAGAKGLEAFRKEAEALGGGSYNLDQLARQADQFNDNLDKLSFASRAAGRGLANDLLPSLNDTTEAMLAMISQGQTLNALLRGLAGIGKLPLDLIIGNPFDSSVQAQIGDLKKELATLENRRPGQAGALMGRILYGKDGDLERRIEVTKNQLAALEKHQDKLAKPEEAPKKKTTGGSTAEPDKPKRTRTAADDAARLIAQLNEQIALKKFDAESTEQQTAAEQQRAKVLYQLNAETLKASPEQRAKITGALDKLVELEEKIKKQKEYTSALDKQDAANVKANQSMLEQIATAEKSAELYGLNAAQINAVTQSRIEEAIALASLNGAMPEHIAFMEAELELQKQLGSALEKNDLAGLLAQTETARKAKTEAQVALLDRAKAAGDIGEKQYQEAIDALKGSVSELDEFTKSAAKNMQSAFADFLFDPFAEGADQMAYKFAQTVQRMAAEALSAKLMESLFGDYASNKKTGDSGILGGLFNKAASFDWAGLFGFADGGIMTSSGPLPLHKYASGGIASSPQLAVFGEGRTPEAFVPLPDGRNIPVKMQGGQQAAAPAQNIRIVNAFDNSVIGDYLGSAAGERIIMNAVQRNAGAFRQALA